MPYLSKPCVSIKLMFNNNTSRLLRTILSISLVVSVLLFLQSLYFTSHDEINFVQQHHALIGKLGWAGIIACLPISLLIVFINSNMKDQSAKKHKVFGLVVLVFVVILMLLALLAVNIKFPP